MQQAGIELYAQAYQQLASISAVLGGLAFTAAAALLAAGTGRADEDVFNRPAKVTIVTAVASAVCLIAAALMWSFMAADLSRLAAKADLAAARALTWWNWLPSLGLLAGAMLFFASMGASGWIASRRLGWLTTVAGVLGILAVLLMIKLFADL